MGSIWNVSYRGGAVTNIARQAQNHLQGTSGCCARILGLMPKGDSVGFGSAKATVNGY